jgi:hypothetical protein
MKRLGCVGVIAVLLPVLYGKSLFTRIAELFKGPPAQLSISVQVPSGTAAIGSFYKVSLTAKGGKSPYVWKITGPIWAQGALSSESVLIVSGVPDRCAISPLASITGTVSDKTGKVASVSLNFRVNGDQSKPLVIASGSPPCGAVGTPYQFSLQTSGGCQPQ